MGGGSERAAAALGGCCAARGETQERARPHPGCPAVPPGARLKLCHNMCGFLATRAGPPAPCSSSRPAARGGRGDLRARCLRSRSQKHAPSANMQSAAMARPLHPLPAPADPRPWRLAGNAVPIRAAEVEQQCAPDACQLAWKEGGAVAGRGFGRRLAYGQTGSRRTPPRRAYVVGCASARRKQGRVAASGQWRVPSAAPRPIARGCGRRRQTLGLPGVRPRSPCLPWGTPGLAALHAGCWLQGLRKLQEGGLN
jgi:hypothetical protein